MSLAHLTRAGQEQHIAWIAGSVHHIVLDAAATAGRLAAVRSSMSDGAASPVHVHDDQDETVVILDGQCTVWVGPERWRLGSGDTVFLPRGIPHTYAFTSETAEILTFCNPAGIEELFRAAGWDLAQPLPADWAVDFAVLPQASRATGQRVLGPPLAPQEDMPASLLDPSSDAAMSPRRE